MKLPKIFQGVGGDALTGIAAAAAVGANPLLGLLATPYLKTRREGVEADTAGQLLENQGMQRRLDMLDALPGIFSAQQSTGVMAPGAKEGEAMRVAGTLPSLAPYLLENKSARPDVSQQIAAIEQALGRPLTQEEIQMKFGLVPKPTILTPQQQRIADMEEETARLVLSMRQEEAAAATQNANAAYMAARDQNAQIVPMLSGIVDSVSSLRGTWIEPGTAGVGAKAQALNISRDWSWVPGLDEVTERVTGLDPAERQQVLDAYAMLNKQSSLFTVLATANSSLNGSVTLLNQVNQFAPGENVPPAVIDSIVAQIAQETLNADARNPEGYRISNAERAILQGHVERYKSAKINHNSSAALRELLKSNVLRVGDKIRWKGEETTLDQADVEAILSGRF